MKQKDYLRYIYKLSSKQLKKANWNLTLPLKTAMKEYPDNIVSISSSQVIRFIDELNGIEDNTKKIKDVKKKIKKLKYDVVSKKSKDIIIKLYEEQYELEFAQDYICIIMENNNDYNRANQGFTVNGIKFKRLLGTNGGIKNSTIVYVNEQLYPELKKRLDNGRDETVKLVPAKLEAYQALICSGSTVIPQPKGIIVVNDCITYFNEDIIKIDDEKPGEPVLSYIDNYEIEHNASDGFGLMLPSYSRKVNAFLTDGESTETISGINTRYAWTKGMVYTFDYIEFAEKIAGTYEIIDAWGDKRDVRNAEVILTVSMLKLWDSYKSWEDYYNNCQENHYQFSAAKVTPEELENVRDTNYQFLQSYDLTDEELDELCQSTIEEIKGVLGMDYRKSLTFLTGFGLNDNFELDNRFDNYVKALMIDKRMINDPFIRRKIYNMIKKRIEMAERGAIRINANFAIISGDPFALCQSMFGLPITGLLQAGEVYHKYWIDKGADEIVCFRAPMTCHNNIRKMKLCNTKPVAHWYQYMKTTMVYNAWDTSCEAMNGQDFDGDTNFTTDDVILLKNTKKLRTIICIQRKANKKVPTEQDIIEANILAFNDDIGIVTNHITSMFAVQAGFEKGSKEYETLAYRIMCGQAYQQQTIDRAKGIICKPMPKYWYSMRDNKILDSDSEETIELKKFNQKIVAHRKPYFMIHIYPKLKKQKDSFEKNTDKNYRRKFGKCNINNFNDLKNYKHQNPAIETSIMYNEKMMPTNNNACVTNLIAWKFENIFDGYLSRSLPQVGFDYSILKSDLEYSKENYNQILRIYKECQKKAELFQKKIATKEKMENDYFSSAKTRLKEYFKRECEKICLNEDELCNIVIDICYKTDKSKQFAWDVCGEKIVKNLLIKNNYLFNYPMVVSENEDYSYCGLKFVLNSKEVNQHKNDNIE